MQSYLQYRRLGNVVCKELGGSSIPHDVQSAVKGTASPVGGSNAPTSPDHSHHHDPELNAGRRTSSVSEKTSIAQSVAGVNVQKQVDASDQPAHIFVVGWDGENDPQNPRNYSFSSRLVATLLVSVLGWVVGAASSINSGVMPQNIAEFHVSEVVGSLVTGEYYFHTPSCGCARDLSIDEQC